MCKRVTNHVRAVARQMSMRGSKHLVASVDDDASVWHGDPRPERPARPDLRQGQLRRDPIDAPGERAVRPRARRVHRRRLPEDRPLRGRRWRHALPRRGRRATARVQPKLLQVIQEQEFERVGGTRTIKVDVRIVAATNRNLAQLVEEKRFRDDLYYRLNVFPIQVPPLRERPEDIPALVRFFVQRLARPMNRRVEVIPSGALKALRRYTWPGNVRELANLVERAMILSKGRTLEIPLAELERRRHWPDHDDRAATLRAVERMHILRVLAETKWRLGGPRGAAVRLGMKRTTLQALIRRLGITRPWAA